MGKLITMSTARRGWRAALLVLPLALGCGGTSVPSGGKAAAKKEGGEDHLQEAREVARLATEPSAYQRALELVNSYLEAHRGTLAPFQAGDRDRPALLAALGLKENEAAGKDAQALERKLLTERIGLEPDELREVESNRFSPIDAHYLDFCFQLRDAARALRSGERGRDAQNGLALARQAFAWAMREVSYDPNSGELSPPEFALRLGLGGPRERALVFLALLRQLDLDGCVLAYTGKAGPVYWLCGALLPGKGGSELYLFDPRLGLPIPGLDGGVATLAQLRKQPQLLERLNVGEDYKYDVTPEQAQKAEVYLVFPLSALSARMRFLEEEVFAGHDRVNLALRPERVLERFRAAGVGPVHVWNERGQPGAEPPLTPTRVLRLSLPPQEGGAGQRAAKDGTTNPAAMRYARYLHRLVPWFAIELALHEMGIDVDLGPIAEAPLQALIAELFQIYVQAPRQQIVRGRFDDAARRLVRLEKVLEEYQDAQPDEATFKEKLRQWSAGIKQAFREGGEPLVRKLLLEEDPFYQTLRSAEEMPIDRQKQPRKGFLGVLIFRAAGDVLRKEIAYLKGLRWQEKAERAQGRLSEEPAAKAGGSQTRTSREAADAWNNAKESWVQYEGKVALTPAALEGRVAEARALVQARREERARAAWAILDSSDYFFLDLLRSLHARSLHARDLEATGKRDKAAGVLREGLSEVKALAEAEGLKDVRRDLLQAAHWPAYRARLEIGRLEARPRSGK
jgi:hypothetical protein